MTLNNKDKNKKRGTNLNIKSKISSIVKFLLEKFETQFTSAQCCKVLDQVTGGNL